MIEGKKGPQTTVYGRNEVKPQQLALEPSIETSEKSKEEPHTHHSDPNGCGKQNDGGNVGDRKAGFELNVNAGDGQEAGKGRAWE